MVTGSWGARGDILWSSDVYAASPRIFKVPSAGGTPVALEKLGQGTRPAWLTDGGRFLYLGRAPGKRGVRLASADGSQSEPLLEAGEYAYGGGVVLFNDSEALKARRLDEASGRFVGGPVTVALDAGTPMRWFGVASAADRLVALVRTTRERPSAASTGWTGRAAGSARSPKPQPIGR
ncbi:MAG: hypothetical protein KJ067_18205 [Vicinamibacteria bacterium]|nr:hypothetical protein [Vicinamibacteria bacterium]